MKRFIDKCREGHDIVYAVRTKRKENALKRAAYWAYYRILSRLASINIPLDSGDFCVMSRRVLNTLNALPERNRFVRGLRAWTGYRQAGLEYERDQRVAGQPKYTFRRLANLAFDGLINFSYKPLRIVTMTGMSIGFLGFALGAFVFWLYVTHTTILTYDPRDTRGWTSLILVMLFLSGTQLAALGIVGEYIGRLFEEMKGRPMYLVNRQIGFAQDRQLHPGDQWTPPASAKR